MSLFDRIKAGGASVTLGGHTVPQMDFSRITVEDLLNQGYIVLQDDQGQIEKIYTESADPAFDENAAYYVYLLHDPAENLYKIGYSHNANWRCQEVSSELGRPVLFVGFWECDDQKEARAFESKLHKRFKARRCNHPKKHCGSTEWFDLTDADVTALESVV